MTHTSRFDRVFALLARVAGPPGGRAPGGATEGQLAQAAEALGRELPAELQDWLRRCNGIIAGPGTLLGAATPDRNLDLAEVQSWWPGWHFRGWVPVATDGSGNAYVMLADAADGGHIYFVDCSEDPEALAFVAASSLSRFLEFLLEKELGGSGWPFQMSYVVSKDPDIGSGSVAALPWEA